MTEPQSIVDLALHDALATIDPRGKPSLIGRPRSANDDEWDSGIATMAALLLGDASQLVGSQDSKFYETLQKVSNISTDMRVVMQIELTRLLLPNMAEAMARCWELLAVLNQARPSLAVRRFLQRAARCYLLNMMPECIVMCRAIWENLINERYLRSKTTRPRNAGGLESMKLTLRDAGRRGWLGAVSADDAYEALWLRGNKAAHSDPQSTGHALETLTLTMKVLAVLSDPGPASSQDSWNR
jgi:hypothetical protein